ncbi:hypothetical protein D9M70_523330 [compost metagenome]
MPLPGRLEPDDIAERRNAEQQHLQEEALVRTDRQRLAEESIEAPGQAKADRHPRQAAGIEGEHGDGRCRKRDRNHLRRVRLFLQQHRAEEDRKQRVDIVAERRLDRAAGANRPDIDAPVDGDQHGGQRRHAQHARRAQRHRDVIGTTEPKQNQTRERHRPHDPVRHHFRRRNVRDGLHEEGQKAPKQIGGQREGKASRGIGIFGGCFRVRLSHNIFSWCVWRSRGGNGPLSGRSCVRP